MAFLQITLWGIKLWVLLYFLFSVLMGLGIIIYWKRELVRKKYYELRYAEKIIKVIIHHPTQLYRVFWRIIPLDKKFTILDQNYDYDDNKIIKDNDFFGFKRGEKTIIKVDGNEYDFKEIAGIRDKHKDYIEIHYFYNIPSPLDFNFSGKELKISSKELNLLKENDLFAKLLTLTEHKGLIVIMFFMMILLIGGVGFIIAKMMEYV